MAPPVRRSSDKKNIHTLVPCDRDSNPRGRDGTKATGTSSCAVRQQQDDDNDHFDSWVAAQNDLVQKQQAILRHIQQEQQQRPQPPKQQEQQRQPHDHLDQPPYDYDYCNNNNNNKKTTTTSHHHHHHYYYDEFLECLDPEVVQEQQRILDAIQQDEQASARRMKTGATNLGCRGRTADRTTTNTTTSATPDHHNKNKNNNKKKPPSMSSGSPFLQESPQTRTRTYKDSKHNNNNHHHDKNDERDDRLLTINSTSKQTRLLRIKGTRHTWKDIAQGQATLVQCVSCRSTLQVGQSAKLLYCTVCGDVSSIRASTTGTRSSSSAASTASPTTTTTTTTLLEDHRIATVVQHQEMKVSQHFDKTKTNH